MNSRISEGAVLELLDLVYAAAEEPAGWQTFLTRLAREFRGTGTALVYEDFRGGRPRVGAAVNADPVLLAAYESYYFTRNAWTLAGADRLVSGAVVAGEEMLPDSELVKTEYYNDFLRPCDARYILASIPFKTEAAFSYVGIYRPERVGPFSHDHRVLLEVLTPHVRRALRIHERLFDLDMRTQTSAAALDRMPTGIILIGEGGQVILMNKTAKEIVARRDGLSFVRGEFSAGTPSLTAALRGLIRDAVFTEPLVSSSRGGALALPRQNGRRPLEVRASPLKLPLLDLGRKHVAGVVFVADPEHHFPTDESILKTLHGFTSAEARLACLLATGATVREAADLIGVSPNTVRTQLNGLFRKTGARRQSDLIALISRCPSMGSQE